MIRRAAPAFAAAALLLASCRDRPPHAEPRSEADSLSITGRWTAADDDVEFFDGGRLLLRRGMFRGVGRYEWVEPGRVLVTYEGALAASVPGDYRVQVQGDSLALCETDRPARCIRYTRHEEGSAPDTAGGGPWRDSRGRAEAAPRLAQLPAEYQSPPEARAREAEGTLKQAYVLQSVYRAEHGVYARDLEALREVGWETPSLRHFHPPRIVRADERLCMVVEPRAADLWPVNVDGDGTLGRGLTC